MQQKETFEVHSHTVSCDGGKGALGHPLVYLYIPEGKDEVICNYCDRKFVYRHGNAHPVEVKKKEKKKKA